MSGKDARGWERNTASGGAKTQARTMLVQREFSQPPGRRPLAIVPQIWETMIRMSRAVRRVLWTICWGIALTISACCGGGPTHKCDFTPPNQSGNDGGSDGPILCGSQVCEIPQVCCLKKSPAIALCVDLDKFESLGCEKMDLPCFAPADCPQGVGLTCCLQKATFEVTCRAQLLCPGDGVDTYVACTGDEDCPAFQPTCTNVGTAPDGKPFSVCGGFAAQSLAP